MTQTPEATVLHLERQFNQAVLNRDIAAAQSLLAESYFLAIGISGDSGEAERIFRREAERHSGMIPNTIGA